MAYMHFGIIESQLTRQSNTELQNNALNHGPFICVAVVSKSHIFRVAQVSDSLTEGRR